MKHVWASRQKGFTIVELLIVIVVIAILAAISIVAYNGIQQRARDAQRKSDLAAIAKAVNIYNIDNSSFNCLNSGSNGSGSGWFNADYDGSTTTLKSIAQCLVDSKALSKELKDPSGVTACGSAGVCRAYMMYVCGSGVWLYASLESEPAGQDGPTNGTCVPSWDTGYGMNYAVRVN